MKRRTFIHLGALSPAIAFPQFHGEEDSLANSSYVLEKRTKTAVKGAYDVIVCGAGPAGVVAAIEAGRNGARTLLVETHGCLGGTWTSGLLSWILDQKNKSGILREIIDELKSRNAVCPIPMASSLSFDVEEMKLLLEELCVNAGVHIQLHTRVVGTYVDKSKNLTHILTESKSGREAWRGKIFIDATGDGDLAALAGCGFSYGESTDDPNAQPFSLLAFIGGIRFEEVRDYVRWIEDVGSASKKRLLNLIQSAGYDPSYKSPGIYPVREDLFMLMANHEYGYKGFNAEHVTQATLHARKEVNQIIKVLRGTGGVWKDLRLISTAEQIGTREGRRIHGLYTVTIDDLAEGHRHEDAVCRVTFGIDVHSVLRTHEDNGGFNRGVYSKPYDIPLRALIAKDVNGLMMAGRCISGDFLAHSSYRVTGNAALMGEAAGKVAAEAALTNKLPQQIPWSNHG